MISLAFHIFTAANPLGRNTAEIDYWFVWRKMRLVNIRCVNRLKVFGELMMFVKREFIT